MVNRFSPVNELSWRDLNAAMTQADEAACLSLLKEEKRGKRRLQYLLRIHSRLNKVRADRERAELRAWVRGK